MDEKIFEERINMLEAFIKDMGTYSGLADAGGVCAALLAGAYPGYFVCTFVSQGTKTVSQCSLSACNRVVARLLLLCALVRCGPSMLSLSSLRSSPW